MNEPELASKKILVVDNESDITFTLQSILEDNGFIVDVYTDPVLALTFMLICTISYCLILKCLIWMDLNYIIR
jgi:DNA-binding response OmpR family regulator